MFGLGHRTRESARPAVVRSVGMAAGEFGAAGPHPPHGVGALPADAALGPVPADAQSDADQADHCDLRHGVPPLVRLAAALVATSASRRKWLLKCRFIPINISYYY